MKKFRAYEHFGVTKLRGRTLLFKTGSTIVKVHIEVGKEVSYKELIKIQEKHNGYEFIGVE